MLGGCVARGAPGERRLGRFRAVVGGGSGTRARHVWLSKLRRNSDRDREAPQFRATATRPPRSPFKTPRILVPNDLFDETRNERSLQTSSSFVVDRRRLTSRALRASLASHFAPTRDVVDVVRRPSSSSVRPSSVVPNPISVVNARAPRDSRATMPATLAKLYESLSRASSADEADATLEALGAWFHAQQVGVCARVCGGVVISFRVRVVRRGW